MSLDLHNSMTTAFDYITCYSVLRADENPKPGNSSVRNAIWQCTDKIRSNNTHLLPTSIYPDKTTEDHCNNKIRSGIRPDIYQVILELSGTMGNVTNATGEVYNAFPFESYLAEMRAFVQEYDSCTSHYLRHLEYATTLNYTSKLTTNVKIGEGYIFEVEKLVSFACHHIHPR